MFLKHDFGRRNINHRCTFVEVSSIKIPSYFVIHFYGRKWYFKHSKTTNSQAFLDEIFWSLGFSRFFWFWIFLNPVFLWNCKSFPLFIQYVYGGFQMASYNKVRAILILLNTLLKKFPKINDANTLWQGDQTLQNAERSSLTLDT